ncbi:alpha/beta hydrolase family protein [Teredinibacter purpureus]|uniref:alpha/beta hydrolase family protein n=1 Tax=Teredinibacter purpureus TaxID=2731756 RepID=UPI0005F7DBC9|nr:alpha/beta fold hydrolase [Teredinibacter purpureus]
MKLRRNTRVIFVRVSMMGCLVAWLCLAPVSLAVPTVADYGALPVASMMRMSPDGELIAFRKVSSGNDYLVVYSIAENKLIHTADVSDILPKYIYFISDHELILVMSSYRKIDGYRGTHNVSSAFILDIHTGKFKQLLTPGHKIHLGQTGLGSIVGLSPDKKFAFMPAYVGKDKDDQAPNYALVKVRLDNPRKLKVVETGNRSALDYFVNSAGEVVAQERYNNRNNKHQILVPDGRSWRVVYEIESSMLAFSVLGITADGKHLVVLDESSESGRTGYYLMSLADGSFQSTNLNRPDKDIEGLITDVNRVVYGVRYSGFTPSYKMFDEDTDKLVQSLLDKFLDHSVWINSWTADWKNVMVFVEGTQIPGDYYTYQADGSMQFIASSRPQITVEDINPIASYAYYAEDGLKIPTLLTLPKMQVDGLKNLPAVIMPHGGPASYDRISFDWLAQLLASRGYLVVQPQFRGSEGFGGDHLRAGYGEWGKKMQSDITDGVANLVKKGIVDPNRVCIVGWSYGGFAALAGGAYTPDLYQCVVSVNGVSDLPRMLKNEKSEYGRDHWVVNYWERAMADGKADKQTLKNVSPAFSAEAFQAPVLLIGGGRDKVVPIKQSEVMRSRLKKAGKDVEMITFKKGDHSLMEGEERVAAAEAIINFVGKHLH